MKYFDLFDAEKNKLDLLLAENNLVCEFRARTYPITLTISPDASPEGQMELFAVSEDGATSPDARLILTFPIGEIGMKITGRLVLTDSLLNKIKSSAKKLHKAYVEAFFADRIADVSKRIDDALSAPPINVVPDAVTEAAEYDFGQFFDDDIEDDDDGTP